ncbi:serine/threonine-protein phosphatase 2A activator [Drosophila innubila]|uniref:serine/threonine-protein phosphatase 2A activator n=1 Tax=Drosophila innubila TaxID=198719 RepID=UPI00148C83B9|nr:serine/threonine-protein phosphatase 2A activator [Drosophila innubila]
MSKKDMYEVTEPTADAIKASTFAQRIYTKRLHSPEDLSNWKRSRAYYDLVAYINNTSMAIQGYRQGGGYIITTRMQKLCKIFNWLERLIYEHHPLGVGQGLLRCVGETKMDSMDSTNSLRHKCHRAFRHWLLQVQEKVFSILEQQVKPHCKHINELAQYLTRAFGSLKNYDYGPGNELMFLFYLCGLFKSGILQSVDTVAAALLLYQRYLDLVRRIILFYRLSAHNFDNNIIDNRNVLPYLWGCAQLCHEAPFTPPQWEMPEIMVAHRRDYMLLSSLDYLQKTMQDAPLGVHSYQLWCVLSLSNWPDAYSGLMRTFLKNILNDFYIVQDLIFSEMMSFNRQPSEVLQRAYLGKFPKQATSSSSQHDEEAIIEEDKEEQKKEKQKGHDFQKNELPVNPPVSRHNSLDTDVFLGFQDPRKLSDYTDDTNVTPLRRPHYYHYSLARKTSSMGHSIKTVLDSGTNLESGDSNYDTRQLNELLRIDNSSQSNTTLSYYSI